MIEAEKFIAAASENGFNTYTGVPCSFLTPFINHIINNKELSYICSANEGDAVATAAGLAIGGQRSIVMLQNSGLGNAVSPLTSLIYTFKIPVLLIITLRGDPNVKDEPQHELMGKITGKMLELMDIAWEYFPDTTDKIHNTIKNAVNHMYSKYKPYALIMKKGSVKTESLSKSTSTKTYHKKTFHFSQNNNQGQRFTRKEVLSHLQSKIDHDNSVLLASTGFTGRELYALDDRNNQLYMVGSMGCASSMGLGIAQSQPDKSIIVIDGDGSTLMRMGNLATVGNYAKNNYLHIILDNEIHDSTGGQSTVSANVNFAKVAQACGYPITYFGEDLGLIDKFLTEFKGVGPRLIHLKIKSGTMSDLPRPEELPHQVLRRLMDHLATTL